MQDNQQSDQYYTANQDDPYANTAQDPEAPSHIQSDASISWSASEFVHHEKNVLWYLGLAGATIAIAAAVYFILNQDTFTLVIVLLLGVVFGIAAARKPRVLNYMVDDFGLAVDKKQYKYEDFKSFSLEKDSAISSLIFMPVQRFSPPLTLYVPSENIDDVIDLVGVYLPLEQQETGYVDKFLSRIRF